jgi:puromycin-sensitive aminopeptidase
MARLPKTIAPEKYTICLRPDLAGGTFAGEETIVLTVKEATDSVVLNAADLEVPTAQARPAAGVGPALEAAISVDAAREQVAFRFAEPLTPGGWLLDLRFRGRFNPKLRGLYRSTFRTAAGDERSLIATQFEPTDARRAFPSFDEPEFKARFQISVVIDEGLVAVSNASEAAREPEGGGKVRIEFAETPRMSTYLVALVVGPFAATEPVDVDEVKLRVLATPEKRHLTSFAERVGVDMLRFYRGYYDIPYPGEKLDLIAIPDFEAGAMENLGAITFRETALLVDEPLATAGALQYVARVVSHEIAHMWFGDLVTMAWWDDLWLNESFATWMEVKSVADWRPEWEAWNSFALDRQAAMSTDGLVSTRPIFAPVANPAQANEMFDAITYEKGASVLRMLEQFLGEETFRGGVGAYLREHAFANARNSDLWAALGATSGQPVNAIMDTWIHQPGYPLIDVAPKPGGAGSELMLRQERFLYDPPADLPARGERWRVPVLYRVGRPEGAEPGNILLEQEEMELVVPGPAPEYVLVNSGGHGFYRVRYAPELLRALIERLQSDLAPVERFTVLNDAWALVRAGKLPVAEYLDLTAAYRAETDRNVWDILIGSLGYLDTILPLEGSPLSHPPDDLRPAFARLVRDRLGPAMARLGWAPAEGEPVLTRQLRGMIVGALGRMGEDPEVQARARDLHVRYRADPHAVDANLVPALVGIVAHAGDGETYDALRRAWKEATTPEVERRYMFSLAGFRRPALLERTLADTLNGEIRTQDAAMVIRAVMGHREGRELAWQFVKDNWEAMRSRYPVHGVVNLARGVADLLSEELRADARAFFDAHPVESGERALAQSFERLDATLRFRDRELPGLREYLKRFA